MKRYRALSAPLRGTTAASARGNKRHRCRKGPTRKTTCITKARPCGSCMCLCLLSACALVKITRSHSAASGSARLVRMHPATCAAYAGKTLGRLRLLHLTPRRTDALDPKPKLPPQLHSPVLLEDRSLYSHSVPTGRQQSANRSIPPPSAPIGSWRPSAKPPTAITLELTPQQSASGTNPWARSAILCGWCCNLIVERPGKTALRVVFSFLGRSNRCNRFVFVRTLSQPPLPTTIPPWIRRRRKNKNNAPPVLQQRREGRYAASPCCR